MSSTVLFSETQGVPKGLRVASFAIAGFVVLFSVAMFVVMNNAEPALDGLDAVWYFVAVIALPVALLLWFNSVRQTVQITDDEIIVNQHGVQFKPKIIKRSDVQELKVRKLNAFGEFGGWGIRYGFHKKWGYVWAGDHAIDVLMKDGRRFVISVVDHDKVNLLTG